MRSLAVLGLSVLASVGWFVACSKAAEETPGDVKGQPDAGPGDNGYGGGDDAGGVAPDGGPAPTACRFASDCTPPDKCKIPRCDNRQCGFTERTCLDECADGCDPATGLCKAKAEGAQCDGGKECLGGLCSAPLNCGGESGSIVFMYCGNTKTGSLTPENHLSQYACGNGELGGETRFKFQEGAADSGTVNVTFTMTATGDGGPMADLDLFVLEGGRFPLWQTCTRRSACQNPVSGGTVAGVTNSSNETVTVTLQKGLYYDVVVDGKQLLPGDFTIQVTCN